MEVKFVLDTSAIIAFLENEAGAETVLEILEKAESGQATYMFPLFRLWKSIM